MVRRGGGAASSLGKQGGADVQRSSGIRCRRGGHGLPGARDEVLDVRADRVEQVTVGADRGDRFRLSGEAGLHHFV